MKYCFLACKYSPKKHKESPAFHKKLSRLGKNRYIVCMKNSAHIRFLMMAAFISLFAFFATRTDARSLSSYVPCDSVLKATQGTNSLLSHPFDAVTPCGVSLSSPTFSSHGGRRTQSSVRSFSLSCKEGKDIGVLSSDPLRDAFRPLCGFRSPGRYIHMICSLRR